MKFHVSNPQLINECNNSEFTVFFFTFTMTGHKPAEVKPWPGQKSHHVTEYGLDPEIVEKLKIKNLITKMENVSINSFFRQNR